MDRRVRRRAKGSRPRFGKAFVLGGLLLFGTLFGGGMLALHSGELGRYAQGVFVFTDTYLRGGSLNEMVVITATRQNDPVPNEPVTISLYNQTGPHVLFSGKTGPDGLLTASVYVPPQSPPGHYEWRTNSTGSYQVFIPDSLNGNYLGLEVKAAGETILKSMSITNEPASSQPFVDWYYYRYGDHYYTPRDAGPSPGKLYLMMDKPRYQPGQTIHLRTLALKDGGVVNGTVTYEVQDPGGNKLFRANESANRFGITFIDYPISDILSLGTYRITATAGPLYASKSVPIEKYVLPKINIDFKGLKQWYGTKDEISGSLEADYFFGKPVEGTAEVSLGVRVAGGGDRSLGSYSNWNISHLATLSLPLAGGKCDFSFDDVGSDIPTSLLNSGTATLEIVLTAEVTDTGGHLEKKSVTVPLASLPFLFYTVLDTVTPGQPSNVYVAVRDPLGQPIKGAHVAPYFREGPRELGTFETDERGIARFSFVYNFEPELVMSVYLEHLADHQGATFYLGPPSAIKVVPDKRFYSSGETARVTVLADPADDLGGVAGEVIVDVQSNGSTLLKRTLTLDRARATFSFTVTGGMVPSLEIGAKKLSSRSYGAHGYGEPEKSTAPGQDAPGDYFSDRYTMAQDRAAVAVGLASQFGVNVTAGKTPLRPGEEVELAFHTFGGNGPVSAALAVAIVDEALLAMGGQGSFDEIRADLQKDPGFEQYSVYSFVWGDSNLALGGLSAQTGRAFYDYLPANRELFYSSTQPGGTDVRASPSAAATSQYALLLALMGVLGYFAIIGLGIRHKKAGIALLAAMLLLAGVVPGVVQLASQPMPGPYSDTGQPLQFSQETQEQYSKYHRPVASKEGSESYSLGGNDLWNWGWNYKDAPSSGGDVDTGHATNQGGGGGSESTRQSAYGFIGAGREVTVRTWFPELWYWNPLVVTDEAGNARITLKAPDSITTWRIDALASTEDGRVGTGNGSVVVFQPFFVDPDLPVSVVRNDRFTFKVQIYNYEAAARTVTVKLGGFGWFQVIGTDTVTAEVAGNSVSKAVFTIVAKKVGTQNLTVSGTTDGRQDIVTRSLRVEPDGALAEDIRNGQLEDDDIADLVFSLDRARIAGSENAYLKLQASLASVIMDGADGFIHQVSGCGEQSTSSLSVDILAYENYIKGNATHRKAEEYKDTINKGIQHEAQYLSTNTNGHGRAIVWHAREKPDLWLTAWAIQAYADLLENGFLVDERIIPDLQTYLVSNQSADGSWQFPSIGHWSLNDQLQNRPLATTAYITRALLVSGMSKTDPAVQRACDFIEGLAGAVTDSYTRALCLDALELADGSSAVRDTLAQALLSSAIGGHDGGYYWHYAESRGDSSNDIETTGFAVMALAKAGASSATVSGGASYLVLSRAGGGSWGSTHNSAVAFMALNGMSEISPLKQTAVEVLVDGTVVDTVHLDRSNKDLTFLTDLRPWFVSGDEPVTARTVSVTLRSTGEGGLFYHLYTKQHIDWAQAVLETRPELALTVGYSSTNTTVGTQLSASALVSYNGPAPALQMVLVDLRAPTGFVLDETDFQDMLERGVINFYEFRSGGQALVYIDGLTNAGSKELGYTLTAMAPATSLLQHVNAFDMYNTTLKVELGPVEFNAV